ncbi:MAG: AraC family transcriptional regulator, partial [Lachnospiraceae bacterium]|nr:AraC family transcriptional regulator [Lachnospiraceae bacterium]
YCLTRTVAPAAEIRIWSEPVQEAEDLAWGDTGYHGSWVAEQRLFKNISEGRFEDHSKVSHGRTGNMSSDPLRQAKNEMIVFAVLCSRAAIIGGVSSEGALNLSDYFVQRIEAAETVPEVHGIGAQMHQTYINRVRRARDASKYSALVRNCRDYVETHIFERITIGMVAKEFGYSETYISRKYKEETGESLVDYANRQKMNTAKTILEESDLSIAELSERLSISSPSYFSALFRKQFGVSPMDYQKKGRQT